MVPPGERVEGRPNALAFAKGLFNKARQHPFIDPTDSIFIEGKVAEIESVQRNIAEWQFKEPGRLHYRRSPAIISINLPDREQGAVFFLTHYSAFLGRVDGKRQHREFSAYPRLNHALLSEVGFIPPGLDPTTFFNDAEITARYEASYRVKSQTGEVWVTEPKVATIRFWNPQLLGEDAHLVVVMGGVKPRSFNERLIIPGQAPIKDIYIVFESVEAIARCGQDPKILKAAGIRTVAEKPRQALGGLKRIASILPLVDL